MTTLVKQRKVSRSKGNEDERNIIVSKEMKDHVIIKNLRIFKNHTGTSIVFEINH